MRLVSLKSLLGLLGLLVALVATAAEARPSSRSQGGTAIVVQNDRMIPVTVIIDGHVLGTVPAESGRRFATPKGRRSVQISLAGGRSVLSRSVTVPARQEALLVVPAWEGRLIVRNGTGRAGRLLVGGVDMGLLRSGAEMALILDPGRARIELMDGRLVLDSGVAAVASGGRTAFVAQAPRLADVRLVNMAGGPVEILVDGRRVAVQAAGASMSLSLAPGRHTLSVRCPRSGRVLARSFVADVYEELTLRHDLSQRRVAESRRPLESRSTDRRVAHAR